MKLNIHSLDVVLAPIARFFHRFHTIMFFVVLSAGIAIAIIILLSIIELSNGVASTSNERISGTFDQATMSKVEALDSRNESEPGSRESPFVE